jgi:hypothetical protein
MNPTIDYNPQRSDMPTKVTPKKNAAAQTLGRLGGQANTKAQNRARKQNAQLAGRPRRVCTHCNEPVVGGHADRALDESCGRHGWRWERAGTGHPAPPSPLLQLLREAHELLNDHATALDIREWNRAAKPFLGA